MRIEITAPLFLMGMLSSCGDVTDPTLAASAPRAMSAAHEHTRAACAGVGVLDYDILQRTCAMYVAVRSGALEETVSFGRDFADLPVHWNTCPGGTMVACAVTPMANGDTLITGLPMPH